MNSSQLVFDVYVHLVDSLGKFIEDAIHLSDLLTEISFDLCNCGLHRGSNHTHVFFNIFVHLNELCIDILLHSTDLSLHVGIHP